MTVSRLRSSFITCPIVVMELVFLMILPKGPYLNDIGHNTNNANNGNQTFPLSFKYGYFGHSNFPLLFKYDNFDNIKSTLSYSFFPMSFKNGTKSSVVI